MAHRSRWGIPQEKRASDAFELLLDVLFRRIDDQLPAFSEHQVLDLHETEQPALRDTPGVDLVDLSLVEEDDFVETVCHVTESG